MSSAHQDKTPAASSDVDTIEQALESLRRQDAGALDRLVALLYQDLRRLARQRLRGERDGHTLGTTALAHEAYVRLCTQHRLSPTDRDEFLAIVSNTMRRVLVDYARRRGSQKRGAGAANVALDELGAEEPLMPESTAEETLALDAALSRLEAAYPRAAQIFERRLFGGVSVEELAVSMNLSLKTIQRDYNTARAWLRKEIGRDVQLS